MRVEGGGWRVKGEGVRVDGEGNRNTYASICHLERSGAESKDLLRGCKPSTNRNIFSKEMALILHSAF